MKKNVTGSLFTNANCVGANSSVNLPFFCQDDRQVKGETPSGNIGL